VSRRSDRARSLAGSCIAVRLLASVNGGGAGNGTSADATKITAPIRRGPSGSGPLITAITGASGEPRTPSTPNATAWRSAGAMAIGRCHVLQRWTRHRRFLPWHQGHRGWFRGPVAILQRRTRGRSNWPWFQRGMRPRV